ncbi:MAG: LPS export ABC transporter periplasmic protein LptC [Vulcanimicrobiota bacterium]
MNRFERLKRVTKYGFVALFILFFCFLFLKKDLFEKEDPSRSKSPTPAASPGSGANVELQLTKLLSKKDKIKYWEMEARRIKVSQVTQKGDATDINVTFFDEKGQPAMTLNSHGADIDMKQQSLYFRGTVTGHTTKGDTVEIRRLVWDGKKKKLFGYEYVKITKEMAVLTGRSLVGDPSRKYLEIIGDVDVVWKTGTPTP